MLCFAISVTQQERLELAQAFQVVLTAGKVVHHRGQLLFGGADFAFHIKEGCAIFILQGLNLADKAIHHCIRQLGKLVRKRCNPFLLQQLQHLRIGQPLNGLFCLGLQRCCVRFDFGFQCLFLFGQFFYAAENTAGILCFGGAVPPQFLDLFGNLLRHKASPSSGKALLIGVLVVPR